MIYKKSKIFTTLVLILFLILSILYCRQEQEQTEEDQKKEETETPTEVTIYVYDSFTDNLKNNIKEHMKTNYSVEANFEVFTDTGPMVASIIREKDNPKADLVVGIDNSFGLEILNEDVLIEYTPAVLNIVDESLIFDKTGKLTPYDYGYVVINYNSETLQDLPEAFDDLTNEKYSESIALMSPKTSSTGRIFLLETISRYGEDGYIDFWKNLKPSITSITSGWSDAYYGLYIQGESDMVVSYTTSPPAHIIYEDTDIYKSLIFNDSAYIQVEACGIIKNAKNQIMAKKVLDYIVSKEFQKIIPENQFMYPINADVELSDVFKKYAKKPDEVLILDTNLVKNNIDRWLSEWEDAILE